jgi:cyclopropane fatty-acyl-phospholipid synthase-like methyltransferase
MCKLAGVKKGDVVFDLGCGDGRIVITAITDFGATRGVGVDIDPERIAESLANSKEEKVTDKVKFRLGDVLQQIKDLQEASVVMLYMGRDVNLRLMPILKKTLKPGSRIVSHDFDMGSWRAEKTITIEDEYGDEHLLYLWTIGKKAD